MDVAATQNATTSSGCILTTVQSSSIPKNFGKTATLYVQNAYTETVCMMYGMKITHVSAEKSAYIFPHLSQYDAVTC